MLWILTMSFNDFAHNEDSNFFNKDKWSVFSESSLVTSEIEQMAKSFQDSFN